MNIQPGPIAKVFRFDSPAAIWKFMNWLPLLLLLPFVVTIALLDIGFSWIRLGVTVICGVVVCIAYYILRNLLVSKGAARRDLDAISKGIGRSTAATALIGGLVFVVAFALISIFTKATGTYEAFVNETNLVMQFVIGLTMIVMSVYLGWKIKGRKVYEKYLPKPVVGESQ